MDFHESRLLAHMVPRLSGHELPGSLPVLRDLVRMGIGGFIVFGGELDVLREAVGALQAEAREAGHPPLVICSDLERGLGQQVRGGTEYPPAAAMARAEEIASTMFDLAHARIATEAAWAGINVILAPVADVDVNPANPIIATRSFGPEAHRVGSLVARVVRVYENSGVRACAKHYPGHGDTGTDSHLSLPVLDKTMNELTALELVPFARAMDAGVSMVMPGHLHVPVLDPELPASLSRKAIQCHLRGSMGFRGIVVTDALDMGALKDITEPVSARLALEAGADIILHPTDALALARALAPMEMDEAALAASGDRMGAFRQGLLPGPSGKRPAFDQRLAQRLTQLALRWTSPMPTGGISGAGLVILSDDRTDASALIGALGIPATVITDGQVPDVSGDLIVAVFSEARAWKGGAASWLRETIKALAPRTRAYACFGPDGLLADATAPVLLVSWGSEMAQQEAANELRRIITQ